MIDQAKQNLALCKAESAFAYMITTILQFLCSGSTGKRLPFIFLPSIETERTPLETCWGFFTSISYTQPRKSLLILYSGHSAGILGSINNPFSCGRTPKI